MQPSTTTIAVLGGGGRTGTYLVSELLNQGFHIKLLLRNPDTFTLQHPGITIMQGDATDPQAILALTENCQAIISTIGQRQGEPLVASNATENILGAMTMRGIQRYILVAGINVDTPFDKKGAQTMMATEWMKTTFPIIHADRQKAYAILSESPVNWTLVRVPMIAFEPSKGAIIVSVEDCKGSVISAADIATFLVAQLADDTYNRQAPFIANAQAEK